MDRVNGILLFIVCCYLTVSIVRIVLNWKLAKQSRNQQKEIEDDLMSIQNSIVAQSEELKQTIQMIHHEQQHVMSELNKAHRDIDETIKNGPPQSNDPPTPSRDAASNLDDE